MKTNLKLPVLMMVSLLTIALSSCGTTRELEQLSADAKKVGQIRAGFNPPPYPAECRTDEPHAQFKLKDSKAVLVDRERRATDRANARKNRCGPVFYDNLVKEYGTSQAAK